MLSEDLQSLHDLFKAYGSQGVSMQAAAVKNLCANLQTVAADARALEACIPEGMCTQDAEVVDLDGVRSRKETNDWLRSQGLRVLSPDPDGGDAA